MSADEDRLTELEGVAASLMDEKGELRRRADRHRGERDRLNESVKSLRAAAKEEKGTRDRLNQRVAEVKGRVEELRHELDEKRGMLAQLDEEQQGGRRGLPPRRALESELQRIEWELSTTPTLELREREDGLIERARDLKKGLEEHDLLDAGEDRRLETLAELKAVELEIRAKRDEMQSLRDASQEHHEAMLRLHREADEEAERSDEAHAAFLEGVSAIKEVDARLDVVMGEIRELRGRLREASRLEASRRDETIDELRRELLVEARRKMEAGEKLSIEELKLVYGEEEQTGF